MFRRAVFLILAGVVLVACDDDPGQFVFDAIIVDGDGGNPAAGTDATTLRIALSEGDLPVQESEFPVTEGQFEAVFEFASFNSVTRARVEIEGATTELLTAPPTFVPSISGGFMRLVTSAPSSCEAVSFNMFEAPRADFGMVQSGTFALVVGGTSADEEQVEFFDSLEWISRLFTEDIALSFLGPTRAASISEGEILVLPSNAAPFIFNMVNPAQRVTQVVLHAGAGPRSAIVSVPGVGAMVVGGEAGDAARAGVSLVAPGGSVTSSSLSTPRSGPAAAALGADVLVVGGDADGTAEILLAGSLRGEPIDGVSDGTREQGLLVSDGETRALLVGGADAQGTARQDTLAFDGCPGACVASTGPSWVEARLRATLPEGGALLVGGDDSRLVDEVRWGDDSVAIETVLELQTPRASPGVVVYESGVFVVAGGADGGGPRDDFEFCVPSVLAPL